MCNVKDEKKLQVFGIAHLSCRRDGESLFVQKQRERKTTEVVGVAEILNSDDGELLSVTEGLD